MINFDKMVAEGGSFVPTGNEMDAYRAWAAQQSCIHCGAKASERERDENGRFTFWWNTETDCGCRSREQS